MKLILKKAKFIVVIWSRTYALRYADLALGGAELEEVRSLRIFWVTFDSKLTYEIHLHSVVSKAARSPEFVIRAGKLFGSPLCSGAVSMHMFCST